MKSNNLILIFCSITLFFLISSCNRTGNIKIGLMMPTYEIARYTKDRDYFVSKAKELGAEVIVTNAENDDLKQLNQARELFEQGVNVLVITAVNQNTAAEAVREANQRSIKVLAYERLIQNCNLDYYITFDSKAVGQEMAKCVLKIKPDGNYLLLGGDKGDRNAVLVKQGQKEELSNSVLSKKIQIVYDIYVEDWSSENAYQNIKYFLKLFGCAPDVILSSNDGMAEGTAKALSEFGLDGKVLVTGQDAELSACKRIVAGTQIMTVYKPLKKQGEIAAVVAVKMARGEQINEVTTTIFNGRIEVPSILLTPIAVDKSNLKNTIIADGFYKEEEIYKQK